MSLLWLLTRRDHTGTRKELGDALEVVLKGELSLGEAKRAIDEVLERLTSTKVVDNARRVALRLTRTGQEAARAEVERLGIKLSPAGLSWRELKKRILSAPHVDLTDGGKSSDAKVAETTSSAQAPVTKGEGKASSAKGNDALPGKADEIRAAILARRYQLDLGPSPTLAQVRDALTWRQIEEITTEPFGITEVREVLLNRLLAREKGERLVLTNEKGKRLDWKTVLNILAANAVGARKADAGELYAAFTRQWLRDSAGEGGAGPQHEEDSTTNGLSQTQDTTVKPDTKPVIRNLVALPVDEAAFAARVKEAAKATKSGRVGEDKVLISHVRRRLEEEGAAIDDVDAFKARLVSAHRKQLLSLGRADLVEAVAPEDVDASETHYMSSTFHFVRI
ncbi:hypothetical protein [Chondromyces crocatus]|uniref:hypothetical protein n=1 Tax=Chondromyces crocatus TaxID=52 RepID=UPI0012E2925D|nr:hypothetical protein [Chondromyces crocatus]